MLKEMDGRMDKGLERLIGQVFENVEQRIREEAMRAEALGIVSPIERYFYLALREVSFVCMVYGRDFGPARVSTRPFEEQKLRQREIRFWPQCRALDWPADFLLGTLDVNDQRHFAVVECDGHEFHERTKEQAERDRSRDRAVQAMGWRIIRFTGSELYRDAPMLVTREIFTNWALPLWLPR